MQEGSLTQMDAVNIDKQQVQELTGEQIEELEMLRKAVEDLKWKLNYDKGVFDEMTELLEKKVAAYLVQINTLQESEAELKEKTEKQESQIEQM